MCLYLIAGHGVTEEQSACHAQAAVIPIAGTVYRAPGFLIPLGSYISSLMEEPVTTA